LLKHSLKGGLPVIETRADRVALHLEVAPIGVIHRGTKALDPALQVAESAVKADVAAPPVDRHRIVSFFLHAFDAGGRHAVAAVLQAVAEGVEVAGGVVAEACRRLNDVGEGIRDGTDRCFVVAGALAAPHSPEQPVADPDLKTAASATKSVVRAAEPGEMA